jgi:hypothetical protein
MLRFIQTGDAMTKRTITMTLCAAMATAACAVAAAQDAPPTYKGDPDVYKVIYEDAQLRIIEAVRKAGVTDKAHGHPVPSIVYSITDCQTKQTTPDGKTMQTDSKAGAARAVPVVHSHTATNTGTTDCKQLFIEKK